MSHIQPNAHAPVGVGAHRVARQDPIQGCCTALIQAISCCALGQLIANFSEKCMQAPLTFAAGVFLAGVALYGIIASPLITIIALAALGTLLVANAK